MDVPRIETPPIYAALSPLDQKTFLALCKPTNNRTVPVLLRLFYRSQTEALKDRQVMTVGTARWQFARWLYRTGKLAEW